MWAVVGWVHGDEAADEKVAVWVADIVVINDDQVAYLTSLRAPERVGPAAAESAPVPAPLVGNIFEVLVKPGQRVEEGERVLVLEAMKMETDVAAPRAGTVAEVRVKPGDAVAVGDVLLTIGG